MLKPSLVVDTVVSTLQTIPELVTAMAGDSTRIYAFHFRYGLEKSLTEALNQMIPPSTLVVWSGTIGGNFSGYQIWKHHIDIYFRAPNTVNISPAIAYEDIWWLMMNKPVNSGSLNIRQIEILPSQLDLMETPSVEHHIDEEGQDFFCGKCVFGEIGDQP